MGVLYNYYLSLYFGEYDKKVDDLFLKGRKGTEDFHLRYHLACDTPGSFKKLV